MGSTQQGFGTITVAGCGNMGLPMATALFEAGFDVQGFDVATIDADFPMVGHAQAGQAELLISVVRDREQTLALLYDVQALLAAGQIKRVIVCSTLSIKALEEIRARSPEGVEWIDAPMSGAPVAAIERRLSFMLGGDEGTLDGLAPLFEAMGDPAKRFYLGPFTSGMKVKLLNNFCGAASVVATREVFDRAARQGIDRDQLRAVMGASTGQNWFVSAFDQVNFAREGYDPANTIGIIHKDVTAAIDGENSPHGEAILAALRALEPLDE